ncbi:hypothetical protein I603_0820 [Erythrobacter dokdonensis DSW-74]|uniref:Uncharacterized protein n=1 Tax=Erythrobacter dokdonensis DSW-74 TaxID=1300349 RepID=A0A1A7BIV2_9SPHN|nr:hypothetical protein I603_0820 [Erythrobacter dokdonensis DSW-74]
MKLADRPLIAKALGNLACELSPDEPLQTVRAWFDTCWPHGDRWQKRRRYVQLPSDKERDETKNDSFISSGRDWAALIEEAIKFALARSHVIGDQYDRAHAKYIRTILAGTEFGPKLEFDPSADVTARGLIASFARKVEQQLSDKTRLVELWAHRLKKCADGIQIHYLDSVDIKLGYLMKRRRVAAFVVPAHLFGADGSTAGDDQETKAVRCIDWLHDRKFLTQGDFRLPAIKYDEAVGFGWCELESIDVSTVNLSIEEKPDGTPGLELWVGRNETGHNYWPATPRTPMLKVALQRYYDRIIFESVELDHFDSRIEYEFVDWSLIDQFQTDGFEITEQKIIPRYFIVDDLRDIPGEPSGWLHDKNDAEVHRLLFAHEPDTWFHPQIAVLDDEETPALEGTVAAAIFANMKCPEEDQIGHKLIAEAESLARPHLERRAKILIEYQQLIDGMFSNED